MNIHGVCSRCGRAYSGKCLCLEMSRHSLEREGKAGWNRERIQRADNRFYSQLEQELESIPEEQILPTWMAGSLVTNNSHTGEVYRAPCLSRIPVGVCLTTCDDCKQAKTCTKKMGKKGG